VHLPFPVFRSTEAKQYFGALREVAWTISERD
jgi:hypothetical protein